MTSMVSHLITRLCRRENWPGKMVPARHKGPSPQLAQRIAVVACSMLHAGHRAPALLILSVIISATCHCERGKYIALDSQRPVNVFQSEI